MLNEWSQFIFYTCLRRPNFNSTFASRVRHFSRSIRLNHYLGSFVAIDRSGLLILKHYLIFYI